MFDPDTESLRQIAEMPAPNPWQALYDELRSHYQRLDRGRWWDPEIRGRRDALDEILTVVERHAKVAGVELEIDR